MNARRRLKNVISIALVISMLCMLVPINLLEAEAVADEVTYTDGIEGGSITFNKSNGLVTNISKEVTSVLIPEKIEGVSVKGFGTPSYLNLPNLTTLTLPSSFAEYTGFDTCGFTSLEQINIADANPYFKSIDGVVYTKDCTKIVDYPCGRQDTTYKINDSVTTIGEFSFYSNEYLVEVTLPYNLKTIEKFAFDSCYNLTNISFPSTLESIGELAFQWCKNLKKVTIPGLVNNIGEDAFVSCHSLREFVVFEENDYYSSDEYGVLFNKDMTELMRYPCDSPYTSYTIPDTVEVLSEGAFQDCFYIEKLVTSSNLIDIDDDAFYRNNELTLYVEENSKAEWYAIDNNIPYVITGIGYSFKAGRDNNSFIHGNADGEGFEDVKNYYLDKEYYNKLTNDLSYFNKNKIKKQMNRKWSGSCFGVSVSMGRIYTGEHSIRDISGKKYPNYYAMDAPHDNKDLLNNIQYFHLSQFRRDVEKNQVITWGSNVSSSVTAGIMNLLPSYSSRKEFLEMLVNEVEKDRAVIFSYKIFSGGHAVLLFGCTHDDESNEYVMSVYDLNSVTPKCPEGEVTELRVKDDYSDFKYKGPGDITFNKDNYTYIKYTRLEDVIDLNGNDSAEQSVTNDNYAYISVPSESSVFKLENSAGEVLEFNGEQFDGNMAIQDILTVENGDDTEYTFVVPESEMFYLDCSAESKLDGIDIESNNNFYSLKGEGIDGAEFTSDNTINIKGENYSFEALLCTMDTIEENETGLLNVTGKANSEVSLKSEETDLDISAEKEVVIESVDTYIGVDVYENNETITGTDITLPSIPEEPDYDESKIEITESMVSLEDYSLVYDGSEQMPEVIVDGLTEGIDYEVSYNGGKEIGYSSGEVIVTGIGDYTGQVIKYFDVYPTAPKAPSKVSTKLYGYDDVKITWTKAEGASGYYIYGKRASESTYTYFGSTKKLYFKKANLKDGGKYTFRVEPYVEYNDETYDYNIYKTSSSIYTLKKLNKPSVKKASKKYVRVSWNNIYGETGYQIARSKYKSKKFSVIKTVKTTKLKSTKVKAVRKKGYYYKVRAYKVVDGKKICGPWSKVKYYKLK